MLKKIIRAEFPDGSSVEHEGENFVDIYERYIKRDVILILEKWVQSTTGVGYEFKESATIGKCTTFLCHGDYWSAYDKIF